MSRTATFLALLLAGCAGGYVPPAVVQATYRCEGGKVLAARFDNAHGLVDLTTPDGETARLTQQRAASGIWYASPGYELRGKGRDAAITLAGAPPLTCRSD